jgi:hypothetical protein
MAPSGKGGPPARCPADTSPWLRGAAHGLIDRSRKARIAARSQIEASAHVAEGHWPRITASGQGSRACAQPRKRRAGASSGPRVARLPFPDGARRPRAVFRPLQVMSHPVVAGLSSPSRMRASGRARLACACAKASTARHRPDDTSGQRADRRHRPVRAWRPCSRPHVRPTPWCRQAISRSRTGGRPGRPRSSRSRPARSCTRTGTPASGSCPSRA